MKILVTGGAGFIGSHTVDALLQQGHQVRILDSLVPPVHIDGQIPSYVPAEAEFIHGDVCDRARRHAGLEEVPYPRHDRARMSWDAFLRSPELAAHRAYEKKLKEAMERFTPQVTLALSSTSSIVKVEN